MLHQLRELVLYFQGQIKQITLLESSRDEVYGWWMYIKLGQLKLQDGTMNEKGRINIGPEKKKILCYVKLTAYRLFNFFPKIGP